MEKLDLKRIYKHLYKPSAKKVTVVEVPKFKFVMLDGVVEAGTLPENSPEFQQAFPALYGASYTLKFNSKLRDVNPIDYTVMAMEGLWWTESGEFSFEKAEPWYFTLMMMQPEHITEEMFREAVEQVRAKRPNPALDKLRFESFDEGLSLQIMHIGPYADEPKTIEKMRAFAEEHGYTYRGKHHEIYLGDPRRSKPENLKTVLRHPVEKSV
jgi:hypothetical protein